jgi:hypothetical protein
VEARAIFPQEASANIRTPGGVSTTFDEERLFLLQNEAFGDIACHSHEVLVCFSHACAKTAWKDTRYDGKADVAPRPDLFAFTTARWIFHRHHRRGDNYLRRSTMPSLSSVFSPDSLALCAPGRRSALDGVCCASGTPYTPLLLSQSGMFPSDLHRAFAQCRRSLRSPHDPSLRRLYAYRVCG